MKANGKSTTRQPARAKRAPAIEAELAAVASSSFAKSTRKRLTAIRNAQAAPSHLAALAELAGEQAAYSEAEKARSYLDACREKHQRIAEEDERDAAEAAGEQAARALFRKGFDAGGALTEEGREMLAKARAILGVDAEQEALLRAGDEAARVRDARTKVLIEAADTLGDIKGGLHALDMVTDAIEGHAEEAALCFLVTALEEKVERVANIVHDLLMAARGAEVGRDAA